MKKIFLVLTVCCLIFGLIGCISLQRAARKEPTIGVQALPSYSGSKARIAIADFEVKATKVTGEISLALREMLVAALIDSNRFNIVEHHILQTLMREQELSTIKDTKQANNKVEQDKFRTADIIVTTMVTEFEPQSSGGRSGVGGGGDVGRGVLGAFLESTLNKAHLALDIRLVDASSSETLASSRIQGQSSNISGAIMTGFFGGWGLGGGLSVYADTPMEKAIRICIIEAVKYISEKIPVSYYKY